MFCNNCGAPIGDGVSFCTNCGSAVAASAPASASAQPVDAQPANANVQMTTAQPAPAQPTVQSDYAPAAFSDYAPPAQSDYAPPIQQPMQQAPVQQQVIYDKAAFQNTPVPPVQKAYGFNGIGLAGFILGCLSIVCCSGMPIMSSLMGLTGIGLSIAGIAKKNPRLRVLTIFGLILSIIGTIISFILCANS